MRKACIWLTLIDRYLTFGLDKWGGKCQKGKKKKKTERDIIVCWIIPDGRPCQATINRGGAWWTVRCVSRSLAPRHVDPPEVKVCTSCVHSVKFTFTRCHPPTRHDGSYKSLLASCSRSLHLRPFCTPSSIYIPFVPCKCTSSRMQANLSCTRSISPWKCSIIVTRAISLLLRSS